MENKYDQYRRIIEHEDNLINHRVSWLLIAQSFILGACIAIGHFPRPIIIFGLFSTLFAYISIFAALMAVRKIKKEVENDEYLNSHKPIVLSSGPIFFWGALGAYMLPLFFLAMWSYLWFHPTLKLC